MNESCLRKISKLWVGPCLCYNLQLNELIEVVWRRRLRAGNLCVKNKYEIKGNVYYYYLKCLLSLKIDDFTIFFLWRITVRALRYLRYLQGTYFSIKFKTKISTDRYRNSNEWQ